MLNEGLNLVDQSIPQLENLWLPVAWNCGFKSILNTLGLDKAWLVKPSHINEILNTKDIQKKVSSEILERPKEVLGEYIT